MASVSFRLSKEFEAAQSISAKFAEQSSRIAAKLGSSLESLQTAAARIAEQFDSHAELQQKIYEKYLEVDQWHFREFELATARVTEMGRINFAIPIPETALLHWPGEALSRRTGLLYDCVLNATALEAFHAEAETHGAQPHLERLGIATDFVYEHAEVVRRLPPQLPLHCEAKSNMPSSLTHFFSKAFFHPLK